MGPKRFAVATATCAFFVGCYVTQGPSLDDAVRKTKDAGSADSMWPAFPDGGDFDAGNMGGNNFVSTQPVFGPTTSAVDAPPPISGGTLLVTKDGARAIASDPDRDVIYIVNLSTNHVDKQVSLFHGDEPGRLVEDGSGRIHVALRGGSSLVTIDGSTGAIIARRSACPSPRGVDWDSSSDTVYLACATGELVAFPASGGNASARWVVERDLRDVNVSNGALSVTSFRAAQVLRLASGSITRRDQLPSPSSKMSPQVVWRSVVAPSGTLVTVHQAEMMVAVPAHPGGYGDGAGCNFEQGPPPPSNAPVFGDASASASTCPNDADAGCLGNSDAIVRGVLTVMRPNGTILLNRVIPASVPVDVAVSRDGKAFAVAATGNALTQGLGSVITFGSDCANVRETPRRIGTTSIAPTAIAFDAKDDVIVQTREPAALWIFAPNAPAPTQITLSTLSRADTGVDIFHTQAGAMMACAGCHPEGGDDGHVWMLDGVPRRTPSLRGTIAGTAPYHWPGDEKTLDVLLNDVYTQRMSGTFLQPAPRSALENWVQSIPAPPAPSWLDASSVQRGAALFSNSSVGCSTCHSGTKLTNNTSVDVGTGGTFQVPPLVGVGWRTPLLHDGCAHTILDRFGSCDTQGHGSISGLTQSNIGDLVSYLESL
jgi:hypothetical protein